MYGYYIYRLSDRHASEGHRTRGNSNKANSENKAKARLRRNANSENARTKKERKEKKRRLRKLQKRQGAAGRSPAATCAAEGGQLEGKRRVKVAGRVKADRGACRGRRA